MKPSPICRAIAALCITSPFLFAMQTARADTTARDLGDIVVSGSKEGTALRNTPATLHKIDSETLEQEKPVFFGDVVNRIPGVTVNNLGAEQHMASFRQPISTNGVYLYLEDGIPLRPAGLFNHNQVYELNMAGIGDIEVIKGPASSVYGSYATGGLMNFLTRAPSRTFGGSVGVQAGNRGYRRVDIDVTGAVSERQAMRFSAYAFEQTNGFAKNSDADKQAMTLRHDFNIDGDSRLKTVLTYSNLFTETGGSISQAQYDAGQIGASPHTFTNRDIKALRLSSVFERNTTERGLTTLSGFYRDNTTNQIPTFLQTTDTRLMANGRNNVNPCTRDGSGAASLNGVNGISDDSNNPNNGSAGTGTRCGRTSDLSFDSLGMELKHRQGFGSGRSRWITGLVYDQGNAQSLEQRYTFSYSPRGPFTNFSGPIDRYRDYSVAFDSIGLYGQLELELTPSLLMVLGARHDRVSYDYRNQNGSIGVPSQRNDYDGFSPKAGLVFNPTDGINVYTNVSTGFSPPEISSKYGGSSVGLIDRSKSQTIEVGTRLTQLPYRTALDVAVYELQLRDGTYSSENSQNYNADSRHKGVELGVSNYALPNTTIGLSLALTEQTFDSAPRNNPAVTINNTGRSLRYAPEQVATLFAAYDFSERTRLSGDVQYLSPYFMTEANTQEYSGHAVANMRFSHRMGPWEGWVAVRNLTDKKYAEFANVSFGRANFNPGAPRTVLLGLRYSFGR